MKTTVTSRAGGIEIGVTTEGDSVVRLEVPFEDGWTAAATFLMVEERLVLAELTVLPSAGRASPARGVPPQVGVWSRLASDLPEAVEGINSRLLRSVPLGELVRQAHAGLEQLMPELFGRMPDHEAAARAVLAAPRRPGRAGRPDSYFAAIAARYVELCRAGKVNVRLAEEFDMSAANIRDAVSEARRRGLLTREGQGRAGGRLTEKGIAALMNKEEE